jgi:hypothetical protein
MEIVLAIHKPSHIEPSRAESRELDDTIGLLPSIGKSGIKRKASCIKIRQSEGALVFWLLEGFQLALATGKGVGIAPLF